MKHVGQSEYGKLDFHLESDSKSNSSSLEECVTFDFEYKKTTMERKELKLEDLEKEAENYIIQCNLL